MSQQIYLHLILLLQLIQGRVYMYEHVTVAGFADHIPVTTSVDTESGDANTILGIPWSALPQVNFYTCRSDSFDRTHTKPRFTFVDVRSMTR